MAKCVYTTGRCPVCFDFGAVAVLRRRDTDALVFFCPTCACAWPKPPGDPPDESQSLSELAPDGARIADAGEVAGLVGAKPLPSGEWLDILEAMLAD